MKDENATNEGKGTLTRSVGRLWCCRWQKITEREEQERTETSSFQAKRQSIKREREEREGDLYRDYAWSYTLRGVCV